MITNGGQLSVEADYVQFRNSANSSTTAQFDADGATNLFHNSNLKFFTKTDGAGVTGILTANGLDITSGVSTFRNDVLFEGATSGRDITFDRSINRFNFKDNADLTFGTHNDLIILHNGNHSLIQDAGTGNLAILSNSLYLQNTPGNETYFRALNNGAVTLYLSLIHI